MQSDENLDKTYSNTIAWDKNPLTGREKQFVNRFTLPTLERGKLSFSGNERNHLFQNINGKKFEDISGISGIDSIQDGRCFAVLDYDRDGWQDIALLNINTPVLSLFRNQQGQQTLPAAKHKMLAVKLVGGNQTDQPSAQYSSRNGIGARVTVKLPNQTLVRQLNCGEGLAAQNSSTLFFGLGQNTVVDSIEVLWPSGIQQSFEDFKAGDLVTVYENQTEAPEGAGFIAKDYRASPPAASSAAKFESRKMPLEPNASEPKITVFISMATWCPNCKNEIPQLNLLRSAFSSQDLEIVAIPIDPSESEEALQSYVDQFKPPYTLGKAEGLKDRFSLIVSEKLGLDVLPTYVIVDQQGQVRSVRAGAPTVSDLKQAMPAPPTDALRQ